MLFVVRIRKSTLSVKCTAFVANEGGTYRYHCTLKGKQDVIEETAKNVMKKQIKLFKHQIKATKCLCRLANMLFLDVTPCI
jgi:hypothetical protein